MLACVGSWNGSFGRGGWSPPFPPPAGETAKTVNNARRAALPVSAGDRKRFDWGSWRRGCPDLGVPGLAPCPPIAAGSAIGRAGQGPGGSPAGVAGAVGVLDAAAREWIMPGSGGREQRRAAGGG